MNELKITVGDPWDNVFLGKQEAINLFENVPNDVDCVTFYFGNILYVGCLFIKQYLLLKESADFKVVEDFIWERIEKAFEVVENLRIHNSDDVLIQNFIDYELNYTL